MENPNHSNFAFIVTMRPLYVCGELLTIGRGYGPHSLLFTGAR
jgi:hypothetical protein